MARPQRISDEQLLSALVELGEATAGDLATRLGVGQSTAAKRLAALESSGATRRRRGGRVEGVLAPDHWSVTAPPHRRAPAGPVSKEERPEAPGPESQSGNEGRLARGALRTMVRDHLAARSNEDLGATQIAKALGRSPGAVANALARLESHGEIAAVGNSPRRYRAVKARS